MEEHWRVAGAGGPRRPERSEDEREGSAPDRTRPPRSHRRLKFGCRFSAKAFGPSLASSLAKTA